MSIISASTLITTALQYTADTTGTLVFKTGATPTTALTLNADQSATFAGTVNFATAGFTNLSYTGTFTGGTGVIAIGTNQIYKDSSGNVGFGTVSPAGKFEATGDVISQTSLNANGSYYFQAKKSRGTVTVPLTVTSSDTLGGIIGGGYDGTAYRFTSAVEFVVDGAVSTGNVPQAVRFSTGTTTSYTERMRIDSSGNVGIGTSSPGGKLGIATGGSTDIVAALGGTFPAFTYRNGTGAWYHAGIHPTNDYFYIGNGGTPTANISMVVNNASNVGIKTASPSTTLDIYTNSSAGFHYPLFFSANNSASAKTNYLQLGFSVQQGAAGSETGGFDLKALRNNTPVYLANYEGAAGVGTWRFYTDGTERMRIDSSGFVCIGTTISNPGYGNTTTGIGLRGVQGSSFSRNQADWVITVNQNFSDAGSYYQMVFRVSDVTKGSIISSSTSTAYATTSDYRLKETVKPMAGALDKVSLLKPCTYKWKTDGSDGEGFLAHELAEVCPQAVIGEKDAVNKDGSIKPQVIDTSFLVATLTAAIQELNAKVDAQAAEIAKLKGTN